MALVDIVKYNGDPYMFAWKYPKEDLSTWTQLIVNESQEAILFKGGQALDVFPAGRHVLKTENIPLLRSFIKLPFGGRSPFTAEVWYINLQSSLDIKWGTATPIQLQDPKYGIFIPVRAYGQFGIRIADSKKFLIKLNGVLPQFTHETLTKFFKGIYLTKVKDTISAYLVHKKIAILEINAYLDELSEFLRSKMEQTFWEYGMKLVNFYVNDISIPENDPGVKKLKDALAKKAEMEIIGYDYHQERTFNTLEGAAKNPGSSHAGLMGAGMGLGMGAGLGNVVGGQFGNMTQHIQQAQECPKCKASFDKNARFCPQCGCDTKAENGTAKKEKSCSKCGSAIKEGMKFCPECGDPYNPCPQCKADLAEGITMCPECGYTFPAPCPQCGCKTNISGAKFCIECGTSLVKRCPGCSSILEGSPKFCPDCGHKL